MKEKLSAVVADHMEPWEIDPIRNIGQTREEGPARFGKFRSELQKIEDRSLHSPNSHTIVGAYALIVTVCTP